MNRFETRPATPSDAAAVARYHQRCFLKTFSSQLGAGGFDTPNEESTKQQLREWFHPDSAFETLIAVIDGTPVGHVTTMDGQLVHLFVEPDHQGTGLGRHLLALGEASLASNGHSLFELHARVENIRAIAFYQQAGWTLTDRIIHTVDHDISYDEQVLVKRRTPSAE